MKNKNFRESFKNAWAGIRNTFATERNFKTQILMGIVAMAVCIGFRVETPYLIAVVLSIFFVLSMELVNTAVEALTDFSCGEKIHPMAKVAKDAAAGAVLLASFCAVVVGILVAIHIVNGRCL